jgi:MFS superfamily sulfate permease-like transporter
VIKRYLLPITNSASFFTTYANVDRVRPAPLTRRPDGALDRYLLSELQVLIRRVDTAMFAYDLMGATVAVEDFIDTLTNWYIRRSRSRFWQNEQDQDKVDAYQTLHHALVTFLIERKRAGKSVAAYGAAAKGCTLLNYGGVKPDLLPFVCDAAGVKVLGPLPQGLPSFVIPAVDPTALGRIVVGGLAVALVAFADTSVLSRVYAARLGTPVDPNQEMVALGAANLAAGLFQGFPVSSSSSRTPVAEAAGSKTQMTGVVGAVAIALLLMLAPNLLQYLPTAALAAVVISSAIGLIEVADLRRIYRIQQWEFWLSMVCFAGVAVFGAIPGIVLAIVIAVIEFLWDGWRPHSAVLGRVDRVKGYHDITRYPHARRIPGLVLFRWDAPLFFANAELFNQCVLEAVKRSPTRAQWVVFAAEPVTSVDVTAADALAELDQTLHDAGVELCFAEMKDPVTDKLKRFGLFSSLGEKAFFPTVGAAVRAYLTSHDVHWTDPDEH